MKRMIFLTVLCMFLLSACSNNQSTITEAKTEETTKESVVETLKSEKKEAKKKVTIATGSYILFGNYEQDNNLDNGKEPIEWFVLAVENDGYLLMSRYALDCVQMNDTDRDFTYETSKMRNWLNNDFYNQAFDDDEKKDIIEKEISNPYYKNKELVEDNVIEDKIFLIDIFEKDEFIPTTTGNKYGERYAEGDFIKATCKPTPYAVNKGVYTFNNRCWYNTRYLVSNEDGSITNYTIGTSGTILKMNPIFEHSGTRPLLYINKNSDINIIEYKDDDYNYSIENEYSIIYKNAYATGDSGYYKQTFIDDIKWDGAYYPSKILGVTDDLTNALEQHENEVNASNQAHNEKYKKMYLDSLLSLGLPDGVENADYKSLKRNCEGGSITFPRYYRLGYNFMMKNGFDKGTADDSFNFDRTDFPDGLQDNDGNGIDDRDPINSLGCIDRNCDGIDDRTWMDMSWYQPKNKYLPNGVSANNGDRQYYPCYKCEHNIVNKCEGNLIIIGSHNNYENAGSVSIWDNENSRLLCSTCRNRKDSQNKQTHDKNLAIINAGGYAEYAGYSIGSVKNLQGKDYTYKGKDVWEAADGSTLISGLGENDELRWGGTGAAGSSR